MYEMRAREETSRNVSSVLVTGTSWTGNTRRNRDGFIIPAYFLQEEEYGALVEMNLPTAIQAINNDASSCLVIGTSLPSSRDSEHQGRPSTVEGLYENIVYRLQSLYEQLKRLLHEMENLVDKFDSFVRSL